MSTLAPRKAAAEKSDHEGGVQGSEEEREPREDEEDLCGFPYGRLKTGEYRDDSAGSEGEQDSRRGAEERVDFQESDAVVVGSLRFFPSDLISDHNGRCICQPS